MTSAISVTKPPQRRLANLQALRALAALGVVLAHTGLHFGSWHTAGTFGVDIFFVLSGFIMAMISAPEGSAFFAKRLTRILPPYWTFTLLAYAALVFFPAFDTNCIRGVVPLLKSLLFVPFAQRDGTLSPVLGVGWTLNYEMCFYVLIALGLMISKKRPGWAGAVLVVVLMLAAWQLKGGVFSQFYGNTIMLEFVMGILAFQIYVVSPSESCCRLRPLLVAMAALAFGVMYWYEGTRFYQPSGTRLYFLVCAYVLVQSVALVSRSGWEVRNRAVILVGDASYTLYLSHVFVLSVIHHLVARKIPILQLDRPLGAATAILISTACAVMVFVYLERPVHQALNRIVLRSKEATAMRVPAVQAPHSA